MDKWGYSYLIDLKTLWEKEKLLVKSNFSFSHNVFKSCLLLMRHNEYLWSKGLTLIARELLKFLTCNLNGISRSEGSCLLFVSSDVSSVCECSISCPSSSNLTCLPTSWWRFVLDLLFGGP